MFLALLRFNIIHYASALLEDLYGKLRKDYGGDIRLVGKQDNVPR